MFPEEEVIRRIVEGETELFALLADRYGRAVHALVYRIVGNPEDAEEVTQEVLLKALPSWPTSAAGAPSPRGCTASPATRPSPSPGAGIR